MKKYILTGFAFLINMIAFAQSDVELKLTLRDGNVMSGTSKITSVSLSTDYGKLEIPIKNVTALDLGISTDKATSDKVAALVKQLSNSNEQMRKSAYDELVKMDIKAIPAINNILYSSTYESEPTTYTDYTADAALLELQSKFNVTDGFSSKLFATRLIDDAARRISQVGFARCCCAVAPRCSHVASVRSRLQPLPDW